MAYSDPKTSIKVLLDGEGSDKGTWFGDLYDVLLCPVREQIRCLFEVGVGTLLPEAPSSMVGYAAPGYRPGGSLRAWRDFLPGAEVHGFDVASDTTLSGQPRITTHRCDSTDESAVAAAVSRINLRPDVVIDDGLHILEAQVKTMRNFMPRLTRGGLYVCEDVIRPHEDVPVLFAEMRRLCPSSSAFVYQTSESWAALVVRVL